MTSRQQIVHNAARAGAASKDDPALGRLPEWDLSHLYAGMDAPAFAADMARAAEEAKAFAETYRGKLATMLSQPGCARRAACLHRTL